jgi:hypothetical protein
MSTTPTAAIETLLGLPPLQHVVEKEGRQVAYRLHCSNHIKKSDWRNSANFKKQLKIYQFYWLLLAVYYLCRYLIGIIWWNIHLGRYGYLKLKHGFLPMA